MSEQNPPFAPRCVKCGACIFSMLFAPGDIVALCCRPDIYWLGIGLPFCFWIFVFGFSTLVNGTPPRMPAQFLVDVLRGRAEVRNDQKDTDT